MVPDIDSQKTEPAYLALKWSRSMSLTARILAVNLFALILFGGGLLSLDSFRERIIEERANESATEAMMIARSFSYIRGDARSAYLEEHGLLHRSRIRIYDKAGNKIMDSFANAKPTYTFRDPANEPWQKKVAGKIDGIFDFIVRSPRLKRYAEPKLDTASAWPEIKQAKKGSPIAIQRLAPDSTLMITGAAWSPGNSYAVLSSSNPRDIRTVVRAERFNVGLFLLLVVVISILLSLFLARTIVRPLRHLAHAAVKVRLGRAQEVTVPRLPNRRDEIGMLARALSDMSTALRQRIDATEAFAADVAHEIKNPLASMRSALDGMDNVQDPVLRAQLMEIAKTDVQRMDRLISDISEASRVDSHLAKSKFERIDLGDMVAQLLHVREGRNIDGNVKIAFARPRRGIASVMGEDVRLERVLTNLLDNAVSFSPPTGLVEISATCADNEVIIRISDEGPGIPESEREAVFRRFHTERPQGESFGEHSGLGLAIARTIIEGHQGRIRVRDREDGKNGACFELVLPFADPELV
jgi:two-component system, OmpR family, sensor histidine kinase ChvG